MPYILSPEQKVVVDAIIGSEASSTKYFDIVVALQSISKGCTAVLKDGKKILIHIPNDEVKNLLEKTFEENGLDDLTIDLSIRQSMPEIDIIKLRSTLKKQKDTDAIIKHVLSDKRANTKGEQISKFYSAFDAQVLADTRFRDFATNTIYNKRDGRPTLSISPQAEGQLHFTAIEYYKVKKEISKASQSYERQYDLFDHLSLFKQGIWNDISEDRINEIKSQVIELRDESSQLDKDFNAIYSQLIVNSSKEMNATFKSLKDKFLTHEEACIAYQIKSEVGKEGKNGMFTLFKKKKSPVTNKIYIEAFDDLSGLIQSISQEWFNELDAPTSEMITFEYIIGFIQKNKSKSTEFKNKISKNLQQSVQRINKINTSSQEVISLDQRLESFIKKMNKTNIFDLDIDHNILSFIKQAELSKEITSYIEKCHVLLNSSSSYLTWKSFYNSAGDIFNLVFEAIKKLPKNLWIEGFENWYEHQIQKQVLGQYTISATVLNEYYSQANISIQCEVASIVAELHPKRVVCATELKNSAKELHNTLFKKKQLPNASWNATALINRPFMQSFFPIHISDSISHANDYDVVISLASQEENSKKNIHNFTPIESKDIQNLADKAHNFLYLNDYNYNHPIAQLSNTDKLKAAKKLAKYILSLNQNTKIYQLKNASIVSLLPAHDDSFLERKLDKLNVKVIDTIGVLYNRLTESILFTDRKPYLIIKDELINCELHDHLLWQLKLIQLFKDVGYEVLSLNTTDQLKDNPGQFDKMLQKIGDLKVAQQVIKPQSFDELQSVPEEV